MGAWRSAPGTWKPRLPVGSAPPKRRTPKRTSCVATTSVATKCLTGSPTSRRRAEKIRQAKADAQIIVAQDVTQSASDCAQLLPMTDAVEANLGRKPEQVLADGGYCSEENLA